MATATATTVGQQLVDFCNKGEWMEAVNALYGDSIVSVEACEMPNSPRTEKGIAAIRAKSEMWMRDHEVHSCELKGPFPHGEDRFCVFFDIDVTNKPSGQRMQMQEVALYTVEGGKIVKEEFFFEAPPM